jgi:hypothetical protein
MSAASAPHVRCTSEADESGSPLWAISGREQAQQSIIRVQYVGSPSENYVSGSGRDPSKTHQIRKWLAMTTC